MDNQLRERIQWLLLDDRDTEEIVADLGVTRRQVGTVRRRMARGELEISPRVLADPRAQSFAKAALGKRLAKVNADIDGFMASAARSLDGRMDVSDIVRDMVGPQFGHGLRVRRTELDLSRGQLAERARMSYPYLSAIENGTKRASFGAVVRLADALELPPSRLLGYSAEVRDARLQGAQPDNTRNADTAALELNDSADTSETATESGELEEIVAAIVRKELASWAETELPRLVDRAMETSSGC